ncbi:stage II sporulation protein [Paenibacillus darwinianus]|uniref:Stage II sporulation protein n=1 Tax=Paenibacillus darwinianus TaxID=1380763 RepID=A0A9W5S1U6_9BACL|nr:GerMN domain-containing protein [Paenibacillus darwinianus]EXX89405.1 stage II sporulation protein [Paenibacillus darwinianus]EXX90185.1 stage II sporulation protein [Paenibacillus darwinianus]EXX91516.1 stage II sporulation protein [Paenibacillus darwinianus]
MSRIRPMKRAAVAGVLALPLFASGCGLLPGQSAKQIDPPQVLYDEGQASEQAQAAESGAKTQMTLYLKDRSGFVAPVSVTTSLTDQEKAGQKALEMLVDGGQYARELPSGFMALLPKGTQVTQLDIVNDQKLAIVDFSGPFADYNAQDERRMLEAVTWTLTGFPGIERVQIWYEGEKLDEMPVDGYPLDEPLTRAIGVNLELAPGANYADSMPVTVYFSALSDEDEQYYVPITRLIKRDADPGLAALRQLAAGPGEKELNGVMTSDAEVSALKVEGDVATVEMKLADFEENQAAPAEMLQAVVLSVTENTGASKVRIRINGSSKVTGTDNRSYAEPVTRPDHVNALKA